MTNMKQLYMYVSIATESQSGDPDDLPTHWFRPGDPDDDPDVTQIKKIENLKSTEQHR